MKRKLICGAILLMALSFSVSADGFRSLTFTSATGETTVVEADNLEIFFKDNTVCFNNSALVIPLESLVSMEFTDYYSGQVAIGEISFGVNGAIELFGTDGSRMGTFSSYDEMSEALPKGIYVARSRGGKNFKIIVGK